MVETWKILERRRGYVDSWEGGQTDWQPVFRSRRLSDGSRFRVWAGGEASLNLADGSRIIFTANPHPIVIEVEAFHLTTEGRRRVFDLRYAKVLHDVERALGVQGRFELQPGQQPMSARG